MDEETLEKQDSEMKHWNEMMLRAKNLKLTKDQLTCNAGAFCNSSLFKPLPVAELAIVNEALNGKGNMSSAVVSAPGVCVTGREF